MSKVAYARQTLWGAVVLGSLLLFANIVSGATWIGAPSNPPACPDSHVGCNAPLNTGGAEQTKFGGLILNSSNSIGLNAVSNTAFGIQGQSKADNSAGVRGVSRNGQIVTNLAYDDAYSLYGNGDIFTFSGDITTSAGSVSAAGAAPNGKVSGRSLCLGTDCITSWDQAGGGGGGETGAAFGGLYAVENNGACEFPGNMLNNGHCSCPSFAPVTSRFVDDVDDNSNSGDKAYALYFCHGAPPK